MERYEGIVREFCLLASKGEGGKIDFDDDDDFDFDLIMTNQGMKMNERVLVLSTKLSLMKNGCLKRHASSHPE